MAWNFKAMAQPSAVEEKPPASVQKKNYVSMIVAAAKKHGVPVDQAMKVAGAEGGANRWIRSKVKKDGILEPSYGPFQALVGGPGTGYPTGLGNEMLKRGIDPRTDAQAEEYFDVVMETVAKDGGWGQWRGADQFAFGGRKNSRGRAHSSGGVIASGEEAPDFNLLPVDDAELAQVDYGADGSEAVDPIEEEEKTLASVLGLKDVEWDNLFGEMDGTAISEYAKENKEDILAMIMNGVEAQTSGSFLPGLPSFPSVSFDT